MLYEECQDSGMGGMSELSWGKEEIRLKGLYCCPEELEFIPMSNEEPLKDWVKKNKFKIGTPSSVGRRDKTTSHGQGRESTDTYGNARHGHELPSGAWRCLPRISKHRRKGHEDRSISLSCLQDSKRSYLTCVCVYKKDLDWRSKLEKVC